MRPLLLTGIIGLLLVWGVVAQAQAPQPTATPVDPCAQFYNDGDESLPFLMGQGDVRLRQGNHGQAIDLYTCALERDGGFLDAYLRRGAAYYAQGNFALALDDFNVVLEIDSADVRAYINRGVVYMAQGRFGLALGDFDLVLALDAANVIGYNNRATVHAAEGNYDLALADIQQAIALAPDNAALYATRAMIYSGLANDDYVQYRQIAGDEARYPAGEPSVVFDAIRNSRQTETFGVWLPVLIRAE